MPENITVTVDQRPMPQAPIDTSVPLPPNVQRAKERAESYYNKPPAQPPSADVPPAAAAPEVNVEPPAPAPEPQPEPPAPTAPPAPVPAEQWEHRYNSMKGRYDQSQEYIRQLSEQLQRTQREKAVKPENNQPTRLLTEEEERDYGPEFIQVVKKAAQEDINPEIVALRQSVEDLRLQNQAIAMQGVYDALARTVPDWQKVNRSKEFAQWLLLPDVYSGGIRQSLLTEAFQAADAPRVVSFFRGFLSEQAATGSATPAMSPAEQAPQPPRTPALSLDALAAPGRARSASAQQPTAEKPVYTVSDIRKFYEDVRRGLYAGRDAEHQAIERDIFQAQNEGRVKG